jgi:drug/metabolite transporter (DMT)-like permease
MNHANTMGRRTRVGEAGMTMEPVLLLSVAVAAAWGSADTMAARATNAIGTAATTLIAQVAGLLLAATVLLVFGLPTLTPHILALSLVWGIIVGACGAGGYLLLYKALHHGPLAIASPVVSAQGGVTLMLAILILHELPSTWQSVFLAVTFVGVLLSAVNGRDVSRLTKHSLVRPGVAFGLGSMLCFGVFVFGLGEASRATNWLLVVVWARVFSCLLLTVFLRDQPRTQEATISVRQSLWWCGAAVVGMLDMGGVLLLSYITASGPIGIAGMVSSAYGVIPLCVGIAAFHERPAPNQIVGAVLLIAGLVGIAAGAATPAMLLLALSGAGTLCVVLWCLGTSLLRRRHRERLLAVASSGKE